MHLPEAGGPLAYLIVTLAAMFEGEIVFVGASLLVAKGHLDGLGVLVAGGIGAAMGDQLYFYVLRGRLHRFVEKFPHIAKRGHYLVRRVRRHETLTVLMLRFSPGLRVALAAACAYAEVPPVKFSVLNSISAFAWSASLLTIVAYAGPRWLPGVGISGWWSALIPAIAIVIVTFFVRREEQKQTPS